jgi:pyridoxamine 5'-phosphate oxidase
MKLSIEKLRLEYSSQPLLEANLADDPIEQFALWLKEALDAEVFEPNGMVLSTVSALGHPSSRCVLLKKFDQKGFCFFTNYQSRKGEQINSHSYGSLNFWWREVFRQVTIEGKIQKTTRKESEAYFESRPRGAQLASLASNQSSPLASREELAEVYFRLKKQYKNKKIPCPKHWGGYRLLPERMEFWQGQADRLHDRFLYIKVNEWVKTRLSP